MKKLLNTLYVTTDETALRFKAEAIEVENMETKEKIHIPSHMIEKIIIYGNPDINSWFMERCARKNIGLYFLKSNGHLRYSIHGITRGNVLLRKKQYILSEKEEAISIARGMVDAKLKNEIIMLQKFSRNHVDIDLSNAICEIIKCREKLQITENKEILFGLEGLGARLYFSVFDKLILSNDPQLHFEGRNRRPPKDKCNALLSFTYSLVMADCVHALECTGLDPYVGFLHTDRMGKPSLALDLMEELRPFLADRFVLRLINLGMISSEDFLENDSGIYLNPAGKKSFLEAWNQYKHQELSFQGIGKVKRGLLPFLQAQRLSEIIRGEHDDYQAIEWR